MKKLALILLLILSCSYSRAQHMDIEAMMKDTRLRVNGGINANMMYYNSAGAVQDRDPFIYMLTGSINVSYLTFTMPFSYTLTNQSSALDYKVPFDFNRFSIAPKYKWIKVYAGDHAMSYSPYTLNGHPFRGIGVELTPAGALSVSAMGGRLLKAVQGNDSLGLPATYERYGYAARVGLGKEKYKVEAIGFYASDRAGSVPARTDVVPGSNYVGSLKWSTTLLKNVSIEAEYALSVIAQRVPYLLYTPTDSLVSYNKATTRNKAFNARINYQIGKASLGVAYENVDPSYQTYGAMYFNNDLENIGITFASPFFKDRLAVSTQLGYQRDNLDSRKNQTSVRLVGNINMALKVTGQLNLSGSYSNFSATTNRRLNQFDYINMPGMVPADTLDYQQLSQTGNVNLNYVFGKNKNQNLNINYAIAGQANKQGGIIRVGQASTVQNYSITHSINFPSVNTGINTSLNYTSNTTAMMDSDARGGSVSISRKFFKNTLSTNLGTLYNQTTGSGDSSILGIKFSSSYLLAEKHNFALYGIQMYRRTRDRDPVNDLTINLNYSYSF